MPTASQGAEAAPAQAVAWHATWTTLRDGARVRTFTAGRPDAGAPAAVLVHGLGHWTQAAWTPLAAHLSATHRIVAFDLPGFGASDRPDASYSLAYFTSALRAVMAAAGLHVAGLVGHSLGGLVAANYAAQHPDRVRFLGLLAPAGFLRTPYLPARCAAARAVLAIGASRPPPAAFVRWSMRRATEAASAVPAHDLEHACRLARDPAVTRTVLRLYASAWNDAVRPRTLAARLSGYEGQVALVWGRRDRYIPVRALRAAQAAYPHASVLLLPACGHCPALEAPARVARHLLEAGL